MKLWLLALWTVTGTVLLFTHVLMAWRVFIGPLDARWRYLGVLVPVFTPVVAWRGGNRLAPIAWIVLLVAYVGVRLIRQ